MKRRNALLTICLFCLAILISACGGGGKSNPPTYPIIPPQPVVHELILSQDIFEINIGQTDNITVTLDNEDVTENAVYTPDDEGIATVDKGVITAHNQGTTIVNVHVEGADNDKTFTVNVIDPSLPTLELSQDNFALKVGQTDNITVTLEGKDVTKDVTYTPDDEAIATVDKGIITALSKGSTDVVVSLEGANNAIFTVNVDLPTLELSKTQFDLGIGDTDNVTVTLNGQDVTEEVTYTTEDENIATVDKGNIQAQYQGGETTVTVSLEGANNATFTVKVTDDSNEKVPLDKDRYTKLYELGLVDKDYDHIRELTEINIPGAFIDTDGTKYKIISISDNMFNGCTLKTITIPNSVETIGNYAFNGCSSLEKITLGNSVETIGQNAFDNCKNLTTVNFGKNSSLTSIENYAFNGCSSLKEITIPDSVISLGDGVFRDCLLLETITLGNGITEIKDNQFRGLTVLTEITIGDGVKTIGQNAFDSCTNLTTVNFGKGVKTIGNGAFTDCSSLKEITIPDSVTSLGSTPFDSCPSLKKITLGNGITEIKNGQFSGPNSLKEVIIGKGVKEIGGSAFAVCTNLTTVNFGKNSNLTSIVSDAFAGCTSLELTIPDQVETIGSGAFYNVKCISYTENLKADKTNAPWGAKDYKIIVKQ